MTLLTNERLKHGTAGFGSSCFSFLFQKAIWSMNIWFLSCLCACVCETVARMQQYNFDASETAGLASFDDYRFVSDSSMI